MIMKKKQKTIFPNMLGIEIKTDKKQMQKIKVKEYFILISDDDEMHEEVKDDGEMEKGENSKGSKRKNKGKK